MITHEVLDRIGTLSTSAFGMAAALAWNDAIKDLVDRCFGEKRDTVQAHIVYASAVTIVAVLAGIGIGVATAKSKQVATGTVEMLDWEE